MTEKLLPLRMRRLRRDADMRPVPWFVHWHDGRPDYRMIAPGKMERAIAGNRCWICGERLQGKLAFHLGPITSLNRLSADPPSHRECAVYAAQVCPWMSLTEVAAVWLTRDFHIFAGKNGPVFRAGEALDVVWFHAGRRATKREVARAIMAAVPVLAEAAMKEGAGAVDELKCATNQVMRWLPDEDDDAAGVGEEAASPYEPGTAVAVTVATK